jgi:hypothetical protein
LRGQSAVEWRLRYGKRLTVGVCRTFIGTSSDPVNLTFKTLTNIAF